MRELKHQLATFSSSTKPKQRFYAATTLRDMYSLEKNQSFLEEGLGHIEQAIEWFPENPHYHATKSELLLLAEDVAGAAAAMDTAVAMGAQILAERNPDTDARLFAADVRRVQGLLKQHGAEQKQPVTLATELLAKFKATNDVQHLVAALRFAQQCENEHRTLSEIYAVWGAHMISLAAHHMSLVNQ